METIMGKSILTLSHSYGSGGSLIARDCRPAFELDGLGKRDRAADRLAVSSLGRLH